MRKSEQLLEMYPVCAGIIGPEKWQTLEQYLPENFQADAFADFLARQATTSDLPAFVSDLARIEAQVYRISFQDIAADFCAEQICVNPTLSLVELNWQGLAGFFRPEISNPAPVAGEEILLVYINPKSRELTVRVAASDELLALKIVVEGLDKKEIVRSGDTTLAVLDAAILRAVSKGLLFQPASTLRRDPAVLASETEVPEKYGIAETFTLQWHITQACDLHCKHCYDRSSRSTLSLAEAIAALDQLYDFCQARQVYGQVSFSGGNPLLHPQFLEIYRQAAERGLMTAILGNPTTPAMLGRIKTIQEPEFFQVSLEGLEEHNDYIRGKGHFARVIRFLEDLRAGGIYSMVMLTLTRDNLEQVLPLAEILRDRADLFTFNRLSAVGEGAQLQTPDRQEFETFLRAYLQAEPGNPTMALKDNLINIIRLQEGRKLFGGCAGFGCGAAFNFVALLPDGEVHACRKFSSPIGNILKDSLAAIYGSDEARRYRQGPAACRGCRIRHVCGGCLAVIDSQGLDFTANRDPCCFLAEQ